MTEAKFLELMSRVLDGSAEDEDGEILSAARVRTFEEANVLTRDEGFVIKFKDGAEFQITIVQSRRGRDEGSQS